MAAADRHLLFGLIALQNGLIQPPQLLAAFHAWTADKRQPLADHLVALGHLDPARRSVVEAMADLHLEVHGGDAEKSLAALPAAPSTRASLAALGDPEIERTLNQVASGSVSGGDADADRTASFAEGETFANGQRFRILRPHARGGLGAVFVALDQELHREVALKQILEKHADDPVSRARFLLEAEVTGGLEHPGIVPVYGLGTYADGRPYYAMRFIRGDSFKEAVDRFHADEALKNDPGRRSLELRKLLRRFNDICNAVEYAHSRGVIHRDLKPANVVVGKHGETLVVDWGLAKAIGRAEPGVDSGERTMVPSSASGSAETLPGSAMGTPAYMSPEQAEGDIEHLGPHSDVYSLGGTLYYLLTGKPPREGELAEVLRAAQRGEVVAPPPRHDPTIDRALDAVCKKAMAQKPADRYATVRALSEDVERWMADEPVSAWHEPLLLRARRWERRHRSLVTGVAAAVLVALVGMAAVVLVQTQSQRALAFANARLAGANIDLQRSVVREQAARGRAQARFDLAKKGIEAYYTGASEDVLLKQPELEDLRNRLLRTALDFYRELGADVDADHEAGLDPKARVELARANIRVATITEEVGNIGDAQTAFRQALEVRRELALRDPGDVESRLEMANCLNGIGRLLMQAGRPDESMRHFLEARAILEPRVAERPGDLTARDYLASSIGGIASLEQRAGHHQSARGSLEKVLEIRRGLADAHPDDVSWQTKLAAAVHDLGAHAHTLAHNDEALQFYRQALELRKKLAERHPELPRLKDELAALYNDMANIFLYQHDGEREAMRLYRESLTIRAKLVQAHPTVSRFQSRLAVEHYNIGLVVANQGRWGDATDCFRRARALDLALSRANPSVAEYQDHLAQDLYSLAYVSRRLGRRAEAADAYRGARTAWERLLRAETSNANYRQSLADCLDGSARLLESAGKLNEALAVRRESVEMLRRLVQDHPQVGPHRDRLAHSHFELAELLATAGRLGEARQVQLEALAIREALVRAEPGVSAYDDALGSGYAEIARLEVDAGRSGEAISRLEQAGAIYDRMAADNPGKFFARGNSPYFQFLLATALEASGDFAGALQLTSGLGS